jgi:hypothetical protein
MIGSNVSLAGANFLGGGISELSSLTSLDRILSIRSFDVRGAKMTEEQGEPLPAKPIVPLEYAGFWIAWDRDHTRIVASGQTIDATYHAAVAAGEPEPILAKAPHAEILFVGANR